MLKYLLFALILIQVSCSQQEKNTKQKASPKKETKSTVKRVSAIKIKSPKAGELFTIGDEIEIQLKLKDTKVTIDSLHVETSDSKNKLLPKNLEYTWKTAHLTTGTNELKVFAYSGGNKVDSYYLKLRFKSDIIPEIYQCKVIETYPHDEKAYTQGLIFEDGIMYEGTGDYANSSLRKVDYKTGRVQSILSLGGGEYFGEGITIYKDQIIQLTWKAKTGFVYDKNSFSLIRKFKYPNDGWGLTTYKNKLIMSDGSNRIYFLNPEYLTEMSRMEIYDHEGPVEFLNELEYVDGLVYANIYQSKEIIAFNPENGKVIKRIDCSNLVPKGFENDSENVLNGIAYNSKNDRFFITGKHWPSLFEVEFVKK